MIPREQPQQWSHSRRHRHEGQARGTISMPDKGQPSHRTACQETDPGNFHFKRPTQEAGIGQPVLWLNWFGTGCLFFFWNGHLHARLSTCLPRAWDSWVSKISRQRAEEAPPACLKARLHSPVPLEYIWSILQKKRPFSKLFPHKPSVFFKSGSENVLLLCKLLQ